MSRFHKLSHSIWYCKYHIVWTPKYRYRILEGAIKRAAIEHIMQYASQKKCIIDTLNVQKGHVHLIIDIPPKYSVSDVVGILKGRTAIRLFSKFKKLKQRPYWGNRFWATGYCVDTVGLDPEKIRLYVEYQEEQEKKNES
ncbi:IS200/IS605 family transposase [Flammeovirgaceae bacterium SG7u.111]|nr:IS200/IS605 family transposase [Flammeovirgaceae bacterium SG7u.132]WPO35563.1 IS200/IS605 family transposase [Flammeovirgaceae bacterium SG7u.111]MDW7692305.1 IS200/IS605 family transposase [Flammeovirgaceae bacterium SG7u.132]MDW7692602.1 IS200/IS605 family transposase [Flammeovirgaceae bacterium SG7u.132]MDW7692615.1 IS200/IS605 family transposase [Flammeovirgaceae bacterium SG7u.132]